MLTRLFARRHEELHGKRSLVVLPADFRNDNLSEQFLCRHLRETERKRFFFAARKAEGHALSVGIAVRQALLGEELILSVRQKQRERILIPLLLFKIQFLPVTVERPVLFVAKLSLRLLKRKMISRRIRRAERKKIAIRKKERSAVFISELHRNTAAS